MFYFSVLVVFVSLPCGYFSGKIEKLPPLEEARLGDVDVLCDWFCSDDLYDYDSDELSPGPGGRASPRIFCDLCEDKKDSKPAEPPTSTVKTDLSSGSTTNITISVTSDSTTTEKSADPVVSESAATESTTSSATTTTLAPGSASTTTLAPGSSSASTTTPTPSPASSPTP